MHENDRVCKNAWIGKWLFIYKLHKKQGTIIPEELAKRLSNRHFGVGADGIILVCNSKIADFKMRIFNSDGSEAEMCGNGIRGFAKYVYDYNLIDKNEFKIETLAGIRKVKLNT